MGNDPADILVTNNENTHQFEVELDGGIALAAYQRRGNQIIFTHTEVPPALEGHGIGGKLAKAGLEFARTNSLEVVPLCPFIAAYIRRHHNYADLVPNEYQYTIAEG